MNIYQKLQNSYHQNIQKSPLKLHPIFKTKKGGVILIEIIWNCDYDFSDTCLPKYSFTRFDYPFKTTKTSSGFNFRFANKFRINGKDFRVLYKAYGLRFIINVSGTAGKFNIIPLMLTIGAGIGLMSKKSLEPF